MPNANDWVMPVSTAMQGLGNLSSNQRQVTAATAANSVNQAALAASASSVLQAGTEQAGVIGQQVGNIVSRQKTAFAGSGVDVNSEAATADADNTRVLGARDQLNTLLNSHREALGYQMQGLYGQMATNQKVADLNTAGTAGALTSALKSISYIPGVQKMPGINAPVVNSAESPQ